MKSALKKSGALAALALASSIVVAAPASKFSIATADYVLIPPTTATEGNDGWVDVMSTGLKMPSQKDIFVQMALECGVYTRTAVADSAFGEVAETDTADRAAAEAVVMARVRVENLKTGAVEYAHPEDIILCARAQQLTALFNGICYDQADEGEEPDGVVQYSECDNNEELDLAIKTMNASAFNFIVPNVTSGEHLLTLEAKVTSKTQTCTVDDGDDNAVLTLTSATSPSCATDENGNLIDGNGHAAAMGMVGNGSLAVEEVRMIQGETGVQTDTDGDGDTDFTGAFMDFFQ